MVGVLWGVPSSTLPDKCGVTQGHPLSPASRELEPCDRDVDYEKFPETGNKKWDCGVIQVYVYQTYDELEIVSFELK